MARIASYKPPNGKHQLGCDIEQFTPSSGVGFYRGNVVYVKRIYKQSIDLTREIRKELIQVGASYLFIVANVPMNGLTNCILFIGRSDSRNET